VEKNNLTNYATVVHGIRGSSGGIGAEETSAMAEKLEKAALSGDYKYVSTHNVNLTVKVRRLILDINSMLEELDADNRKPKKEKPDIITLKNLRIACDNFDMNGVDAALEELESYEYESDSELIVFLRENAERMNFDEIIQKLADTVE